MTPFKTFLKDIPSDQQAVFKELDKLIKKHAPKLKPYDQGDGFMGYGKYHYRYATGREGDWFTVGLRKNKNSIAIYITTVIDDQYLAESMAEQLKASVGKSCIRYKKAEDIDWDILANLLEKANKHYTGFVTT